MQSRNRIGKPSLLPLSPFLVYLDADFKRKECCLVPPGDHCTFLLSWADLVSTKQKQQWLMLFLATLWSLWLFRNQMVFEGTSWDPIQLINIIKSRFAFWFTAKWPKKGLSVLNIMRGYEGDVVGMCIAAPRVVTSWIPPCVGRVKFNVDGSARGKQGAAGIGGILRNSDGNGLVIFSKSMGIVDSNIAEFLAVREAVSLFLSSSWATLPFSIESDSSNVVAWVNNPKDIPWKLRNVSNHLSNLLLKIQSWSCVHIYREANCEADALARQGVERVIDLVG